MNFLNYIQILTIVAITFLLNQACYGQEKPWNWDFLSSYYFLLPDSNIQEDEKNQYPWGKRKDILEPITKMKVAEAITNDNGTIRVRQFSEEGYVLNNSLLSNDHVSIQKFFPVAPKMKFLHASYGRENFSGGFISNSYFKVQNLSSTTEFRQRLSYPDGMQLIHHGDHVEIERWSKTRPIGLPKKNFFDINYNESLSKDKSVLIGIFGEPFDFTHPYLRPFILDEKPWTTNEIEPDKRDFVLYNAGSRGGKDHGTAVGGICIKDTDYIRIVSLKTFLTNRMNNSNDLKVYKTYLQNALRSRILDYVSAFKNFEELGGRIVVQSFGNDSKTQPLVIQNLITNSLQGTVRKFGEFYDETINEQNFEIKKDEITQMYDNIALAYAISMHPDILFIAAAGNSGTDNDISPQYPASFIYENVISVTSAVPEKIGVATPIFNYGKTSVDLTIPNIPIYTSVEEYSFSYVLGTSFASPYVANVVAKMLLLKPSLSISQIRSILKQTVKIPSSENPFYNKLAWGEIDEEQVLKTVLDN